MKLDLNSLSDQGWCQAPDKAGYDMQIETAQGKQVLEIKRFSGSTRDLHAALLHLALVLQENSDVDRAYLIASLPRMTEERAVHEWQRVLGVLRPRVAKRLALIVVGKSPIVQPDDSETRTLALLVSDTFQAPLGSQPKAEQRLSAKFFEVWKILFGAWLAGEGPLKIGNLATRAGCSYPTVAKVLEVLEKRRELERDSSRSVRLIEIPRQTLREILVLQESLRQPLYFRDTSGRRPDIDFLLRRIEKIKPPKVALGGVVAARYYDSQFDLNGLPRLDVCIHGPVGLGWVSKVDPALSPMFTHLGEPVLVVHPLQRPISQFVQTSHHKLPVADVVETLLDLFEMGFNQQAEQLIKVARGIVKS